MHEVLVHDLFLQSPHSYTSVGLDGCSSLSVSASLLGEGNVAFPVAVHRQIFHGDSLFCMSDHRLLARDYCNPILRSFSMSSSRLFFFPLTLVPARHKYCPPGPLSSASMRQTATDKSSLNYALQKLLKNALIPSGILLIVVVLRKDVYARWFGIH